MDWESNYVSILCSCRQLISEGVNGPGGWKKYGAIRRRRKREGQVKTDRKMSNA